MSAHESGRQEQGVVEGGAIGGVHTTSAPIVVGGLGGSGTRVVAALLQQAGTCIGPDLNGALDNLWFTLLLKRPAWLLAAERDGTAAEVVGCALGILETAMLTGGPFCDRDLSLIDDAVAWIEERGHDHHGSGRGGWAAERRSSMLQHRPGEVSSWGWKEPNSHVYVEHLARRWPDVRFVLVVRNGLDMAFSDNVAQLFNWGARFGVDPHESSPLPRRQLRYWVSANHHAVAVGRRLLGERFVAVSYDDLCRRPVEHVPWLLSRLGLDAGRATVDLRPADSVGRHLREDLSVLSPSDVDAARSFAVDGPNG